MAPAVLVARIVWFWAKGELSQPAEWSSTERWLGRFAAWCFAAGSLVSGLAAGYVAMRVPWADDLPVLLSNPPKVVAGKEPMPVSTAAYLFSLPLGLAVSAAALTDPWEFDR